MPARALGDLSKSADELFVQDDAVSLCLLLNRRARTMRVVDFRAGPSVAKRQHVQAIARREGIEKAFTLVERDELSTWQKLGFAKEGTIPSFYKRSDAYWLGCTFTGTSAPASTEDAPLQSEMRLVAARPASAGAPASPGHELAERTLLAAKRAVRDLPERTPAVKLEERSDRDAHKAAAHALRSGQALTAFEPFGRDVERRHFLATARGGFELPLSAELQRCFGSALIELLHAPRSAAQTALTAAAVSSLCEELMALETLSCFALGPSDDVVLATAFVQAGFRRTGLLSSHLVAGHRRKDAILWSRKLGTPTNA